MTKIKKRADFDPGSQFDDTSLKPLTIALAAIIVAWLVACLLVSVLHRPIIQAGDPAEVFSSVAAPVRQ